MTPPEGDAMSRVSWNRDEDGVIVLYVTDPQGRVAPAADIWLQPLIDKLGLSREQAKGMQEAVAERVSESVIDASANARLRDAIAHARELLERLLPTGDPSAGDDDVEACLEMLARAVEP